MLEDYILSRALVVFDMTYHMNKYDKIGSFVWLFSTFLKSISGKHPITVMKYQLCSMDVVVKVVFCFACHRFCCWRIIENSRKNIRALRSSEGFITIFNRVLTKCDTEDEFEQI